MVHSLNIRSHRNDYSCDIHCHDCRYYRNDNLTSIRIAEKLGMTLKHKNDSTVEYIIY
jgi:hypothetical protein